MRQRSFASPTLRQKRAPIPKLPGTADKGAPLPEIDWDNRRVFVKVGEQADGWPIVEAQPKPRPL